MQVKNRMVKRSERLLSFLLKSLKFLLSPYPRYAKNKVERDCPQTRAALLIWSASFGISVLIVFLSWMYSIDSGIAHLEFAPSIIFT